MEADSGGEGAIGVELGLAVASGVVHLVAALPGEVDAFAAGVAVDFALDRTESEFTDAVRVEADGRLLMVNLTPSDVSDSAGAQTILVAIRGRCSWLKHLFADAGCDRTKRMDEAVFLDFGIEIVRRSAKAAGFEVIPRRWVVERTFGWMIRWRRLVRGDKKRLDGSEAMIHVAMGALLLRRVAHRSSHPSGR